MNQINREVETIFVIEDDEALVGLVKTYLEIEGYRVLVAGDGEQAIERYQQFKDEIHLVISDLEIPKLRGDQVYLAIKKINPWVRIVFASGNMDDKTKNELEKYGVNEFVEKPYHPKEIMQVVHRMLASE